jgi:4'-phosphopantetheinyl transferase EntD
VARASEVLSLGLDAELDEPLDPGLFPRVLTPGERVAIDALHHGERGRHAKLVFSAKECAYKCQYPLSRQFLEFHDVEITVELARRTFTARLLRDAGPFVPGHEWQGRFLREGGVVVTAITLPRQLQ